jgi:APA family basic amino acid/polyamine antiporter
MNARFSQTNSPHSGVSCTLGNGIYVLAGDVIANYAGPSIVFSFIVAGLATFIAGMT